MIAPLSVVTFSPETSGPAAPLYAVIMADIVHSQDFENARRLNEIFTATIEAANRDNAEILESPLTITLGDEFQGLLSSLELAFWLASRLRFALSARGIDTRFVVGAARIESPINRERAWNMMGPGLPEARDKLNAKDRDSRYAFSLPDAPRTERLLDALGLVLSDIESGWTATQRDYIGRVLKQGDKTRKAIAAELAIGVTSLYKVLRAAQFDLYARLRQDIAAALNDLDRELGVAA